MAPRVVVSLITDQNDFQLHQAADARSAAVEEGLDVEIVFADGNAVLQINQLFKYIHVPASERPLAIVVEPVSEAGMRRLAHNAVRAGIGWVLLNRDASHVVELGAAFSSVPVSSVRIDQVEVGGLQARQCRRLLPTGGEALYVEGPPETAVARERREGMVAGLEGSKIQLATINADWTAAGAEKAFHSWWRLKTGSGRPPDLVAGQNDAMAMGVLRVTRDHPGSPVRELWRRTLFTGVDGLPEGGKAWVDAGQLNATIVGPSNTGPALRLISEFLKRKGSVPPSIVQTPVSYPAVENLRPLS